jgi:hypothetical protein
MTVKIIALIILLGLGCSSVMVAQMEKKDVGKRVVVYVSGKGHKVSNSNLKEKIVLEAARLFMEADDFYYKAVSESDLQGFRREGCVEVIFAEPQEMILQAVNEKKIVLKLLVPLADAMCNPDAHIIFGDPEYDAFNLLLNSKGCDGLRKLVQQVNL